MASARAELSQFVDDFIQYATHPAVPFLSVAASKDAVAFADAVRANSFDLSDKRVILSSSPQVAAAVQGALALEGVKIQTAKVADDLGVDTTASSHKRIPQASRRLMKASCGDGRIIKLHAKKPRVRVWRGAALPQA